MAVRFAFLGLNASGKFAVPVDRERGIGVPDLALKEQCQVDHRVRVAGVDGPPVGGNSALRIGRTQEFGQVHQLPGVTGIGSLPVKLAEHGVSEFYLGGIGVEGRERPLDKFVLRVATVGVGDQRG
jgi:hypothetical protein